MYLRGFSDQSGAAMGAPHKKGYRSTTRCVHVFIPVEDFEALKERARANDLSISSQARIDLQEAGALYKRAQSSRG